MPDPDATERLRGFRRCPCCGLAPDLCVCRELPLLRLPFDLTIVQHHAERARGSNTGRLLHKLIDGSELVNHGSPTRRLDPCGVMALDRDPFVLFPRGDAVLRREHLVRDDDRRALVVLLDGSWRQARRMARRVPGVQRLPFVRLPVGPPSAWTLRRARQAHMLCTLEAASRVAVLAGATRAGERMLGVLRLVEARSLFMRGMISRSEMERASDSPCRG